ncbi:MAG: FAD-dependent oxidoreductase, partial [Bacteroidales bacterium]|nr:FAD-dependent oxidoreductase [Bacteroidales bacterium]
MGKTAVIIGAGPAGLTAALELLRQTDVRPLVLEENDFIGGISRTINNDGNRMDIGGHRFFSKSRKVMDWWGKIMPLQGSPSLDDILLERDKEYLAGGPDPEKEDRVMLLRDRVSRILFLRHFFDYPISLKWSTFAGMGFKNTMKAGFGYLKAMVHKLPETSLENFYINKFGRPLYEMFFEDYTEKVWGVHPSRIGADWGAQRVKGLSVLSIIKDIISKPFRRSGIDQQKVETSLIERFIYPKYGPGQLWETVAGEVEKAGGEIRRSARVVGVCLKDGMAEGVEVETEGGREFIPCDYLISSMPVRDLVASVKGTEVPEEVARIAEGLPYRDFITVGVLVRKMEIRNQTHIPTYAGRVPDTW